MDHIDSNLPKNPFLLNISYEGNARRYIRPENMMFLPRILQISLIAVFIIYERATVQRKHNLSKQHRLLLTDAAIQGD